MPNTRSSRRWVGRSHLSAIFGQGVSICRFDGCTHHLCCADGVSSIGSLTEFFLLSRYYRRAGQRFYSKQIVDSIKTKPVWLQDPATYPVIFICGAALVGAFGFSKLIVIVLSASILFLCCLSRSNCACLVGWKTAVHPDVCIDKNKRGSVIRWWGDVKA